MGSVVIGGLLVLFVWRLVSSGLGLVSGTYGQGEADVRSGTFNLSSSALKAMLVTGYTPNFATDKHYSDVSAHEVTGTGYTAGGQALASLTVTLTAANSWGITAATTTAYAVGTVVIPATPNGFIYRCVAAGTSGGSAPSWGTVVGGTTTDGTVTWENVGEWIVVASAANPAWTSSTISATGAIVYFSSGTGSTSTLVSYLDFGGTVASSGGTFTVTLPNGGYVNSGGGG